MSLLTPLSPSVLIGLAALAMLYALCTGPYRDRFRGATPVSRGQQVAFGSGLLLMLMVLVGPVDTLADGYLFSVHMLQHLVLVLGVAPLLLGGTPAWLLRELLDALHLRRLVRWAHHPLVAYFSFNLIFSLAHLPYIYELALGSEPLHALEHLAFLAAAVIMWLPILSPAADISPRYPPLGQVLYLFLQTMPASLVGALLANGGSASYPTYVEAPRISGLSPLEDQQAGGLLMWVGSGLYFLIASGVVFFVWASREEAANRRPVGAH